MNRFPRLLILLGLLVFPSCSGGLVVDIENKNFSSAQVEFTVEKNEPNAGKNYIRLSAQNHGESVVQGLSVDVKFYSGHALIGKTSHVFDALGVDELKSAELVITPGGYPWSHWHVSDHL